MRDNREGWIPGGAATAGFETSDTEIGAGSTNGRAVGRLGTDSDGVWL